MVDVEIQGMGIEQIQAKWPGYTLDTVIYIRDTFDDMDKSGDGCVTAEELSMMLMGLNFEGVDQEMAMAFVRSIDANGDGQIDILEFMGALYARMRDAQARKCCGDARVWKFEHHRQIAIAQKIIFALVALVQLILAIVALAAFSSSASNIIDLTTTWTATPLREISFVSSVSSTCPTGFAFYDRNPYFPGVPDKCDCTNRNCPSSHGGQCTPNEGSTGCSETSTCNRRLGELQQGKYPYEDEWSTGQAERATALRRRMATSGSSSGSSSSCTSRTYHCNCNLCDKGISSGALCSNYLISQGCKSKPGQDPREMPIWKSKKICVKYAGLSVADREKAKGDGNTCPSADSKTCGGASSNATVACFENSLPCPITSISGSGVYTTSTNVGSNLPVIVMMSAMKSSSSGSWSEDWKSGKTLVNADVDFEGAEYVAFDTDTQHNVYAANGVNTDFSSTSNSYSIGFRREMPWSTACKVDREQLVAIAPSLSKLRNLLIAMMVIIGLDFVWSLVEFFMFSQSKEFKVLCLRSLCDVVCYGVNLPMILVAASAAKVVANNASNLSECAPTATLRENFATVAAKASTVAGTNIVLLIVKGVKMLFMSALVQFAIWNLMRKCCASRREKAFLEAAFELKDNPIIQANKQ